MAPQAATRRFRSTPKASPENVARALRPDSPLIQRGRPTPIVYRLDLREASSMFAAQSFHIVNRDFLYVSNAPLAEVEKAVQVFSTALAPAGSAAAVYTTVK
jgi:polysaccharide export outer membrane protein